jgi:hypothetical protein
MRSLRLCLLITIVAAGSVTGCLKPSTKLAATSDGASRSQEQTQLEVAEGREEPAQNKPSPCIKWKKSSDRMNQAQRKVANRAIGSEALLAEREKKSQSKDETHEQ